MSHFVRINSIRGNRSVGSYSGLFTGGLRPLLHSAQNPHMLIDRAYVTGLVIGRVTSTGHDIPVLEERRLSVIIPKLLSQKLLATLQSERVLAAAPDRSEVRGEHHVRHALEYIAANFADITTTADLAEVCDVSVRTLENAFRSILDKSPLQVLTEWRLDEARRRLLSPDRSFSVTEVSLDCGFGHLGRFASAYKNRFGETPSQTLRSSKN